MPRILHRLGIRLDEADPPVRRTLLIDPAMRLDELQRVVSAALGWPPPRRYEFHELRGEKRDRVRQTFGIDRDRFSDEAGRVALGDVCDKSDQRMRLLLWPERVKQPRVLTLKVLAVLPAEPGQGVPVCVDAQGEAPPRGPLRAEAAGGVEAVNARLRAEAEPEPEDGSGEALVDIDDLPFEVFEIDPTAAWLAVTAHIDPAEDAGAMRGTAAEDLLRGGFYEFRPIFVGSWGNPNAEAAEAASVLTGESTEKLGEEMVAELHALAIDAGKKLPAELRVDDPDLLVRLRPLRRLGVQLAGVEAEPPGCVEDLRSDMHAAVLAEVAARPHAYVETALQIGGYNDTSLLSGYGVKPADIKALYTAARDFAASETAGRSGLLELGGRKDAGVLRGMEVVEIGPGSLRFHTSLARAKAFDAAEKRERLRLAVGLLSIPFKPVAHTRSLPVRLMHHLREKPVVLAGAPHAVDAVVGTATGTKPAGGDRVRAAAGVLRVLARTPGCAVVSAAEPLEVR